MATQAVVAVTDGGETLVKATVGCEGYNADRAIRFLARHYSAAPPVLVRELLRKVFGCEDCLVVQINDTDLYGGFDFDEHGSAMADRYRSKFSDPLFNARWENGTAAFALSYELATKKVTKLMAPGRCFRRPYPTPTFGDMRAITIELNDVRCD